MTLNRKDLEFSKIKWKKKQKIPKKHVLSSLGFEKFFNFFSNFKLKFLTKKKVKYKIYIIFLILIKNWIDA